MFSMNLRHFMIKPSYREKGYLKGRDDSQK
jgi:hypothetical protein